MITPVNNHILIEPVKYGTFVSSEKGTYEEIGVVKGNYSFQVLATGEKIELKEGDRVYFDSWLASKYPKNDKEFFWLVNWSDVRAIESGDNK